MTARLAVRDLTVRYGGLVAVDGVDLDIGAPAIHGLIGPNGAGKTTLIDALTGFTAAHGRIELEGSPIDELAPHVRTQRGLARTFQSLELFDDLTVRENLVVAAHTPHWSDAIRDAIRLRPRDEDVTWALEAFGIADLAAARPDELSNGARHLVAIARATVRRPRVLLLDEPAAGLDPTETSELARHLRALPALDIAVLLVDHDMGLVFGVCDEITVLDFGRVIATGSPATVRDDPAVVAAYLGSSR